MFFKLETLVLILYNPTTIEWWYSQRDEIKFTYLLTSALILRPMPNKYNKSVPNLMILFCRSMETMLMFLPIDASKISASQVLLFSTDNKRDEFPSRREMFSSVLFIRWTAPSSHHVINWKHSKIYIFVVEHSTTLGRAPKKRLNNFHGYTVGFPKSRQIRSWSINELREINESRRKFKKAKAKDMSV